MSIHNRIDIRVITQAVFQCPYEVLCEKASIWCVFDENRNILNMSESFPSFFFSPHKEHCKFIFKSNVIFIQKKDSHFFIPYEIFDNSTYINSKKIYCVKLVEYKETSLDLLLIKSDSFYYNDNFGNKLQLSETINILKDIDLFKIISSKDWLIAWLIIHDFTTERIALFLNQKQNSVNVSIRRFLGVKKLEVFDRELFKKVAKILGWYTYIPASIVHKNAVKITVYKDIPVKGTYTRKIFQYTHSELN
ncbi:hypothetical protein AB7281_21375 [Providencia rettgeri]